MMVVDGTILLALAVATPHSSAAEALVEENLTLAAPQAALSEALEAARALMRQGHLAQTDFERLPALWPPLLTVLAADAPLMTRAAHFAAAHELMMPAALALALAEAKGAALATLDEKLAQAALDVLGMDRVQHVREEDAAS